MSEISDRYRRLTKAFVAAAIDRFASLDLVVAGAAGFGPARRSPGDCGPEIEVAPGADATTRMLAVLGRRA